MSLPLRSKGYAMKKHETIILLSTEELEEELSRVKHKGRYRATVRSTIFTLITVAAVAVLVATLWLPVLEIYGTAMTPSHGRWGYCFFCEKL